MGLSNGWMLNMAPSEVEELCAASASTGVHYFRTDIPWTHVQYAGAGDWNWEEVDHIVESAISEGMEVIGLLDYFPPWADPSTDTSFWYDFVYEAGLRYIPEGVTVWEMWNEPNISNFWPAPNVNEYVEKILIPGSNAIRQAAQDLNASVTVLTAGLAPAATDGTNISQEDFLTGIYDQGGAPYFDAVGQHPYCWPLDPTIPDPFNWFLKTSELHEIMQDNGDGEKKIWGTELGWPIHFENGVQLVTETEQANYLSTAYDVWKNWDWTGPLIWYAYRDAGDDSTDPEDNFGLVAVDETPKQALNTFLELASDCVLWASNIEHHDSENLEIGPNPFCDQIQIFGTENNYLISIISLQGKVFYKSLTAERNISVTTNLSDGIYLVTASNAKGEIISSQKLVRFKGF